ncbi:MAG: YciI family protein [Thermoleophilia bacterium]|nr:YciI family protein [Thermoleophilia bacterium]
MKFVFAYHGGGMPESEEQMQAVMAAWQSWMESHSSAFLDIGNPIGPSATVGSDGAVSDGGGANPLSGYSLVEAADLNAAAEIAKACPILGAGGSVEIGQTVDM